MIYQSTSHHLPLWADTVKVIHVASTHFKADKGIIDAFVHLRKKSGAGGRGEATAGESVLAKPP